tara:strand:+ start:2399 stop:4372 length:1974 start_codon:yes stop_codon:yes gene_type:complete
MKLIIQKLLFLNLINFGITGFCQEPTKSILGMDRDSYGVYDRQGKQSTIKHPYLVGQAYKPSWTEKINPARNKFDWSELDQRLETAYRQNQRIYLQIHTSYKKIIAPPKWVYDKGVPLVKSKNGIDVYPYWLDPKFKIFYQEMIAALGAHIRQKVPPHLQRIISYVRVDCGIHGDDRPYDDTSTIPKSYQISKSEWMDFKFMAYETYKQAFHEGTGFSVPLVFKHASPQKYKTEWDWIQKNIKDSYGVRYLGDVRGHHFTGSSLTSEQFRNMAVDSDVGLFSRNEMDRAWKSPMAQKNLALYFYWTAIEQLHPGLSIWDIDRSSLDYIDQGKFRYALEFFNRWAAELVPPTAGGGFCIFHEGLDASDKVKFPESKYGKAKRNNQSRYLAICNDPIYKSRGAKLDCPEFAGAGQVTQHTSQTGYNDSGWEIISGNYERFITQLEPEKTSIGLFRVQGEITAKSHPYDRFARSFEHASGKNTFFFDIHDELIDSKTQQIRLAITYLDRGRGSFELKYDAHGNPSKSAFVVHKRNSNKWKIRSIIIKDGRFKNQGPKGSDLQLLNLDNDDDIFHMIELAKLANVKIKVTGNGKVTARHGSKLFDSVAGTYMEGQRLELVATPADGWKFKKWIGKNFAFTRKNKALLYPIEKTYLTAEFTK